MNIRKYVATAMLAIGATAVTAGTAYGSPSAAPAATTAPVLTDQGIDHGIGYQSVLDSDARLVTTVANGKFSLTGETVTLADANGAPVATIPLAHQIGEQRVALAPVVADEGRRLELTNSAVPTGTDISYAGDQYRLQRAGQAAGIGALIGALIGLPLLIGIIPGAVFGALLGAAIGYSMPVPDEIDNPRPAATPVG
ncbi:hypothetical protein IU459_09555 [Nocardia amamiensis]|uniref:DUF8020 domain-containing protein n=1 Tax=Nocardia amamiensis TaxID=404578 RepID=A0ABS0CME3_9NOCA|nr:hypothetical protein [Nocardia amamiensis]MBF6297790.1 hypothetical protein [Nocardia amamiensis]